MSPKMKKGTFGFQNRTDLFKRPTSLSRSPGSTWSFCLGGLSPCLGRHWHPWFISCAPRAPQLQQTPEALSLPLQAKQALNKCLQSEKKDYRRGQGSLTDNKSILLYHKHSHTHFYWSSGALLSVRLLLGWENTQKKWETALRCHELKFFVLPHYIRGYKGKVQGCRKEWWRLSALDVHRTRNQE